MLYAELVLRFALICLLAFGGGQAALPLVERIAVRETGWLSAAAFGTAVAFGYLTPGPVLIVATFVGYEVAGSAGRSPRPSAPSRYHGRSRPWRPSRCAGTSSIPCCRHSAAARRPP